MGTENAELCEGKQRWTGDGMTKLWLFFLPSSFFLLPGFVCVRRCVFVVPVVGTAFPRLVCFLLRSVVHFGFLVFLQICRPEFRGDHPHCSGRAGKFGSKIHGSKCLSPRISYEFHFEGLSNFSASVEGPVQIQDVDPRIL